MKKILIATGNQGKFRELINGLSDFKNIKWLSLSDFPKINEPEENGKTFTENALIKAKYFAEKFNIATVGEDSGLILEAFPKKFGLKTKRQIAAKNDDEWIFKFLQILENAPTRQTIFFSAIAYFEPKNKTEFSCLGKTNGKITKKIEAKIEAGIPVSAVFVAEGMEKVYSALSETEKNKISHRGKAIKSFREFLNSQNQDK